MGILRRNKTNTSSEISAEEIVEIHYTLINAYNIQNGYKTIAITDTEKTKELIKKLENIQNRVKNSN